MTKPRGYLVDERDAVHFPGVLELPHDPGSEEGRVGEVVVRCSPIDRLPQINKSGACQFKLSNGGHRNRGRPRLSGETAILVRTVVVANCHNIPPSPRGFGEFWRPHRKVSRLDTDGPSADDWKGPKRAVATTLFHCRMQLVPF